MIDEGTPVAELVLRHSGCATVFDRHAIDYCCQGHHALARACADRGLELAQVMAELEQVMAELDPEADPRTASTSALINRSLARQHRHLRATLTLLDLQAGELAREFGGTFPTLKMLATSLHALAEHLLRHLDHEEDVLFPALVKGDPDDLVRLQLGHMFDEHREFGDLFRRLRAATRDYRPPDGASANIIRLYQAIAELEGLVQRHHHVENHVLLPRFRLGVRPQRSV